MKVFSWNRWPQIEHAGWLPMNDRSRPLPQTAGSMLAFGNGRSYGDVCLNEGGSLLQMRGLDRFIDFDHSSGRLRCEAGMLLSDILALAVPRGWFLPVTPGTRYVTVGGAIANDVHGKNHHSAGSFGHHVTAFELLRSDGTRLLCTPFENAGWFAATVGGLGLTGCITWAEIQLMPIANAFMCSQSQRFTSLTQFWELNQEAESRWPYTVAWIDCLSAGKGEARGILSTGTHAPPQAQLPVYKERTRRMPFTPPVSLVNALSLRMMNTAYYYQPLPKGSYITHYAPYFYPLDGLLQWNRMYGPRGFFQYQCVLPPATSAHGIAELLDRISRSGQGSFLAVLKTFGAKPAPGLLSFARPGATLALDFPNHGDATHRLFSELDAVVREAGGALYPAKDARMPAELFRSGYPQLEKFTAYLDPQFSSSFWKRINS